LLEDLPAEAGQEVTSLSSRITLDKDERSSFHGERASAETSDAAPEEPLEAPLDPPACHSVLNALRHDSRPPARALHRSEEPPSSVEDLFAVGSPDDKSEEVHDLRVREANPLLHISPIGTHLAVDHLAQAQPARHGFGRIFRIQDLAREVLISDHLE
jgi:hypothetical protein